MALQFFYSYISTVSNYTQVILKIAVSCMYLRLAIFLLSTEGLKKKREGTINNNVKNRFIHMNVKCMIVIQRLAS